MALLRKTGIQLLPRVAWLASVDSSFATTLFVKGFADDANLKKTPLHDFHVEQGGKMVPFAGWSMPIQYKDSIMEATTHCRENASIFDVSHMCGLTLKGKDAVPFLETLVVGDIAGIQNGSGSLTVFTNEKGGIIDDSVVTKVADDEIYLVVNAGCREKDLAHIEKHLQKYSKDGNEVEMTVHDDRSLLALQGPKAMEVLQPHVDIDLKKLYFSNFVTTKLAGIDCFLTRTGYTGEDGFEISVPDDKAVELTKKLLENKATRMCGLGPRDSLRLEAGLCLYGNDLNEDITPIQAGLKWTIGKNRRDSCNFLGGEIIKKQMDEGVGERRVGFVSKGAPARQHSKIYNENDEEVGEVTSGAFSPSLNKNVAMGYVKKPFDKAGTKLKLEVRGRKNDAEVTKMPFVPTTYYKG